MSGVLFFLKCCAIAIAIVIPGVLIFNKVREWWQAEEVTEEIERKIPLSLFLASYEREPTKWIPLKYYVVFNNDRMRVDVTFQTAKERSRYRKWYKSRKKQKEQERIDEQNRKLMDSIAEGYMESVTVESKPVESKPVEAEVPVKQNGESMERLCEDCEWYLSVPNSIGITCSAPAQLNKNIKLTFDKNCGWFVSKKKISKPVEAEAPVKEERTKRCRDCIHCFMQDPETNRMICFNRDRTVQYSYDQACELFLDVKEREEAKS